MEPFMAETDRKLGPEHFERVDESDDAKFYTQERLVRHIDDEACNALAVWYMNNLPEGGDVLDLMSSWVSHLPPDSRYGRVAGLGMNRIELEANNRLTEHVVHDLTGNPSLPYDDASFDACLIAVSVQYLTRPLEVFAEIARVLRPGGICAVSFSNRMFPTKAIALWRGMDDRGHAKIVGYYFVEAGRFEQPEFSDISPHPGTTDPLYLVTARNKPAVGSV
jgi:SAM-dependent methyltransferase